MVIQGPVDQIDAERAQRLLVLDALRTVQGDVEVDLRRFGARVVLEADADPALAVGLVRVAARGHRIGECEKGRGRTALYVELLDHQLEFMRQHLREALAADVARRVAVHRITDLHVVGRDRFGEGAGGTAHPEEPARGLLPRPNLGNGAVLMRVHVDGQRFVIGVRRAFHQPSSPLVATLSFSF